MIKINNIPTTPYYILLTSGAIALAMHIDDFMEVFFSRYDQDVYDKIYNRVKSGEELTMEVEAGIHA